MPENESLDLKSTPRWQRVYHSVDRGDNSDDTAELARRSLYQTMKKIMERIPFDKLLHAACSNHDELSKLICECKEGHEYARLFGKLAEEGLEPQSLLEKFLWAITDRFLEQIQVKATGSENWSTVQKLQHHLSEVRSCLAPEIEKLAAKLAKDPTKAPRIPRRKKATDKDPTAEQMNESMLGV